MAWRGSIPPKRRLQGHFLVRGADDAATVAPPMRGPVVSVGEKVLREYTYAAGTPIAATPQV